MPGPKVFPSFDALKYRNVNCLPKLFLLQPHGLKSCAPTKKSLYLPSTSSNMCFLPWAFHWYLGCSSFSCGSLPCPPLPTRPQTVNSELNRNHLEHLITLSVSFQKTNSKSSIDLNLRKGQKQVNSSRYKCHHVAYFSLFHHYRLMFTFPVL